MTSLDWINPVDSLEQVDGVTPLGMHIVILEIDLDKPLRILIELVFYVLSHPYVGDYQGLNQQRDVILVCLFLRTPSH